MVDAVQGVQAQTINNLYLALEHDLAIIPVINKIDLPAARVDYVTEQFIDLLGCDPDDILMVSAKTGEGVPNCSRRSSTACRPRRAIRTRRRRP